MHAVFVAPAMLLAEADIVNDVAVNFRIGLTVFSVSR